MNQEIQHVHSFIVDCSCECGIKLSVLVKWQHAEIKRLTEAYESLSRECRRLSQEWAIAEGKLTGKMPSDMTLKARIEKGFQDEGDGFKDDSEDDYPIGDPPQCSCPYCHCHNDTIAGGICDMCAEGAHQG